MQKKLLLLYIFLPSVLAMLSLFVIIEQQLSIAFAQPVILSDEKPSITVLGIAEKQIPTDQAKISIAVENTAGDTNAASKLNADKMNKIISALITKGLNTKNISTSSFEIRPNYDNQNNNYNKILSYTAINKLTITTSSNVNISSFIDLALNNGANRIDNIEFATSQRLINDNYIGLLKEAFDNAVQKAQTLAFEGGFSLNGVKKIDLAIDNGITPPVPYFSSFAKTTDSSNIAAASGGGSPTQILPQDNKLTINLPVTFYILNSFR
ncbi:MAG: SIMPL domain-containing protein [Candidatus Nitrosocosmicus sp.]